MSEIRSVAVVGAGTMGLGIAQVFAQAGFVTTLFDLKAELVEKALAAIRKNLEGAVEKNKLTAAERDRTLSCLATVKGTHELKADLILEAVVEDLKVKQRLFSNIEAVNSPQTIFATNTSSLSVTAIASALVNPGNCVGLHFFNPAHIMKLVEVISGERTRPGLTDEMVSLVQRLGKIPVVAKDSPGFIVNRVARHFYLESLKLLEEGKSEMAGIDKLMRASGFKLGPFELMDLIGIDTNLAVTKAVYHGFNSAARFKPSSIQEEKVRLGQLGRKTGKGFYEYPKS